MGNNSIEGVIENSSNYVIEYHIQRTMSYSKPAMLDVKIQPSFSLNSSGISGKFFSFHKKVQYINTKVHSFVRLPPGRVCWSGLTELPKGQCMLSVYVLCMNENEQIYYMCIKKNIIISAFSDVCLRILSDFSIQNLGENEAKRLRARSVNYYYNTGNSLDLNNFLRIGTMHPHKNYKPSLPEIKNPGFKKQVYIQPQQQSNPYLHHQQNYHQKNKNKKYQPGNNDEQLQIKINTKQNKNFRLSTLQKYNEVRKPDYAKQSHSATPRKQPNLY